MVTLIGHYVEIFYPLPGMGAIQLDVLLASPIPVVAPTPVSGGVPVVAPTPVKAP